MPTRRTQILRLALVLTLAGAAVAGCGRKGDLELPASARTTTVDGQKAQPAPQADKPFLLDPLL